MTNLILKQKQILLWRSCSKDSEMWDEDKNVTKQSQNFTCHTETGTESLARSVGWQGIFIYRWAPRNVITHVWHFSTTFATQKTVRPVLYSCETQADFHKLWQYNPLLEAFFKVFCSVLTSLILANLSDVFDQSWNAGFKVRP